MKSYLNIRRFLANVMLALWLSLTWWIVGTEVAEAAVSSWEVREAMFLAKPQTESLEQAKAQLEKTQEYASFQDSRRAEFGIAIRIWIVLTVVGSALFAERKGQ